MVQPVRTENNNSALDMESLEEMLRKVNQRFRPLRVPSLHGLGRYNNSGLTRKNYAARPVGPKTNG